MSLLSNVFARCLACCVLAGCSPSENIDTKNSAEVPLTVQQREKVDSLLASMTVQQKVAQMIQGEIKHVSPDDLRRYGLGSVLNGGGSFPDNNKYSTLEDWVALADAYRQASLDQLGGSAGCGG